MFNTFADVFATTDEEKKTFGKTTDPFGSITASTTSSVDPFGVSSDMKLSASSQRFDDSPFVVETIKTSQDEFNRNGNDANNDFSSDWAAKPKTNVIVEPSSPSTFDPLDDLPRKTSNLGIGNIPHSKSVNLIDPFLIPAVQSTNSTEPTTQLSPIDLLFDLNVDPSSVLLTNTNNSLQHADQVQSSYDLLGLNRQTASPVTVHKVVKSDSLTEIEKLSQTKKTSASLMTRTNISSAASYHTLPTNAPPTSASNLRVQATALSIMTGTTAATTAGFDDQFLDWLTQSDDLMCSVDPKLSGPSKKIDINMIKSTEDLLGSIYRPVSKLSALRMYFFFCHRPAI